MKNPEETSQEERQEHLRSLGWSEREISLMGELPCEVMFLARRKPSPVEEEPARELRPSRDPE